jgi:DNA mismatch repair protein MutS
VVKQTLVGGARFMTQELRDFEKKLVEGESILAQREYTLFEQIRQEILSYYPQIKKQSEEVAYIDFTQSLAISAIENTYVCPEIHAGYDLKIQNGRHPIIEKIQRDFISNDLDMTSQDSIHIIT